LLCFAVKQGTNGMLQTWKKRGEAAVTKACHISLHYIVVYAMQQFPYTFCTLEIVGMCMQCFCCTKFPHSNSEHMD
jgi:hypothetical protein